MQHQKQGKINLPKQRLRLSNQLKTSKKQENGTGYQINSDKLKNLPLALVPNSRRHGQGCSHSVFKMNHQRLPRGVWARPRTRLNTVSSSSNSRKAKNNYYKCNRILPPLVQRNKKLLASKKRIKNKILTCQ